MDNGALHQIIRYDNILSLTSGLRGAMDIDAMCQRFDKAWPLITGIPLMGFALHHHVDGRMDMFRGRALEKKIEDTAAKEALLAVASGLKCDNRSAAHPLLAILYPGVEGIWAEIFPRALKSVNMTLIYSLATTADGFDRVDHKFAQLAFAAFEQGLLSHYQEHLLALQKEREIYMEELETLNTHLMEAEKIAREEAYRAQAANIAKSEFLSNMSHELRTPMHAVLNYAKMGLTKIAKEDPVKIDKYFNNIYTAGGRLLGLLNNLLDLAKLESGKNALEFLPNTLPDIAAKAVNEMDALAITREIHLNVQCDPATPPLTCDSKTMMQVMVNLIGNAIKFSPNQGDITIHIAPHQMEDAQPAIKCRIEDAGDGIPEAELEVIFDKFTQSSKTKTGAGGTGLGLSICREIINAHQGKIWAENRLPVGAAFNFIVPTSQPTATP